MAMGDDPSEALSVYIHAEGGAGKQECIMIMPACRDIILQAALTENSIDWSTRSTLDPTSDHELITCKPPNRRQGYLLLTRNRCMQRMSWRHGRWRPSSSNRSDSATGSPPNSTWYSIWPSMGKRTRSRLYTAIGLLWA